MVTRMNESPSRLKIIGRVALGAALASGVLLYACGDDTSDPMPDLAKVQDMAVPVPHNFEQINDLVMVASCTSFSTCHSTAGKTLAGGLNLCASADPVGTVPAICDPSSKLSDAWTALHNKPAANDKAKAEGLVLVKPCDPDHSFLIKKLELPVTDIDGKVGYGAHMPRGATTAFPPEQLKAIRDWISRGAHLDEPANVTGTTCTLDADAGT